MKVLWIPMIMALGQSSSAVFEGQPDRIEYRWYDNGRLESVRPFRGDKKVGRHRTFWPDGTPRLDARYVDDAYDGEYRSWYSSGQPSELRHFVEGRESGRQQAWTPTGVLYLNYEARNGRHYGLMNARPCLAIHEARS
jgi:antitoxin component YwqK of YwqJK toxin-antitoxin module